MHLLLDCGEGRKLEQFGAYILDRPDPQIIWKKTKPQLWDTADAVFDGSWIKKNTDMPDEWQVEMLGLKLVAKLTPFKHTGIFPEQIDQWRWINEQCTMNNEQLSILNLFGYTGIASLVAAQAGAKVTYVDASKQAVTWARRNQELSGLADKPIRWILDDVLKFVEREGRRGNKYDAVIMDPPVFGHGPSGETWEFNKSMPLLVEALKPLLADDLKYIIINAYAISTSHITLANVLRDLVEAGGSIESGEFMLNNLSTGIWGKWCASI